MSDKTKATYPTELQLPDGTVLSVATTPALKEFFDTTVQVAAQKEKDKLYPTIEAEKNKVVTANSQMQQLLAMQQEQERQHLANQEALRQQINNANQTVATPSKEDVQKMISDAFTNTLVPMLQQTITPIAQRTETLEQDHVAQYRNRVIAEAQGAIMPELVTGKTIAEVDASAALSKKMYAQYVNQQQPNTTTSQQPVQGAPTTVPQQQPLNPTIVAQIPVSNMVAEMQSAAQQQAPVAPQPQTPQQPVQQQPVVVPYIAAHATPSLTDLPDFKSMDPDEFAKNRDAYFAKVKNIG